MKRLLLLTILAPSCGGGGGGSPPPPAAVAQTITLDSAASPTFTPPAKDTLTYTLSGGSALVSLNAYTPTAPNTLQFLGEQMIGSEAVGSATFDWPGYTEYMNGVPLPCFLESQVSATVGLYSVTVQRITQKTNGTTTTSAFAPEDLVLFLQLDYVNNLWSFDHATDLSGNPSNFPRSGSVPSQPGWIYYERVYLYDVFWDTLSGTLNYSLNPTYIPDWSAASPNLQGVPGRQYSLEAHATNPSSSSFSPSLLSITTP